MSVFDTHSGYEQLIDAGVPEPQATAHVKILTTLVDEKLVTRDFLRAELQTLRQEMHDSDASLRQELRDRDASLRQEIQNRDASLRQEIAAAERRTKNWTTTVVGVCTGLLAILMTLLSFFG